jgi:hypothetical protein
VSLATTDETALSSHEFVASGPGVPAGQIDVWWSDPDAADAPDTPSELAPGGAVATLNPTLSARYHDTARPDEAGTVMFLIEDITDGPAATVAVFAGYGSDASDGDMSTMVYDSASSSIPLEWGRDYRLTAMSLRKLNTCGWACFMLDVIGEPDNASPTITTTFTTTPLRLAEIGDGSVLFHGEALNIEFLDGPAMVTNVNYFADDVLIGGVSGESQVLDWDTRTVGDGVWVVRAEVTLVDTTVMVTPSAAVEVNNSLSAPARVAVDYERADLSVDEWAQAGTVALIRPELLISRYSSAPLQPGATDTASLYAFLREVASVDPSVVDALATALEGSDLGAVPLNETDVTPEAAARFAGCDAGSVVEARPIEYGWFGSGGTIASLFGDDPGTVDRYWCTYQAPGSNYLIHYRIGAPSVLGLGFDENGLEVTPEEHAAIGAGQRVAPELVQSIDAELSHAAGVYTGDLNFPFPTDVSPATPLPIFVWGQGGAGSNFTMPQPFSNSSRMMLTAGYEAHPDLDPESIDPIDCKVELLSPADHRACTEPLSPPATARHELFHSIQYQYLSSSQALSYVVGPDVEPSVPFWMESTAEWAAGVAGEGRIEAPDQYIRQLGAFAADPDGRYLFKFHPEDSPLIVFDDPPDAPYGAFVLPQYMQHQHLGSVRELWEQIRLRQGGVNSFLAVIQNRGSSAAQFLQEFWIAAYLLEQQTGTLPDLGPDIQSDYARWRQQLDVATISHPAIDGDSFSERPRLGRAGDEPVVLSSAGWSEWHDVEIRAGAASILDVAAADGISGTLEVEVQPGPANVILPTFVAYGIEGADARLPGEPLSDFPQICTRAGLPHGYWPALPTGLPTSFQVHLDEGCSAGSLFLVNHDLYGGPSTLRPVSVRFRLLDQAPVKPPGTDADVAVDGGTSPLYPHGTLVGILSSGSGGAGSAGSTNLVCLDIRVTGSTSWIGGAHVNIDVVNPYRDPPTLFTTGGLGTALIDGDRSWTAGPFAWQTMYVHVEEDHPTVYGYTVTPRSVPAGAGC